MSILVPLILIFLFFNKGWVFSTIKRFCEVSKRMCLG
jgi:hypothetical protein